MSSANAFSGCPATARDASDTRSHGWASAKALQLLRPRIAAIWRRPIPATSGTLLSRRLHCDKACLDACPRIQAKDDKKIQAGVVGANHECIVPSLR